MVEKRKKSKLLSAIRESMNKSGGCCGGSTCGEVCGETPVKKEKTSPEK